MEQELNELRQELVNALDELSTAYLKETSEQYRNGTLAKRIENELFNLAFKYDAINGGESVMFKMVSTVWTSSRMCNKEMTSLTLHLLANQMVALLHDSKRTEDLREAKRMLSKA